MREKVQSSTHQSALIRQLSEASGVSAAAPSGQDIAERLGAWLSVADAIALRKALQSLPSLRQTTAAFSSPVAPTEGAAGNNLANELVRVRATLTRSINTPEQPLVQRGRADYSSHGAVTAAALPLDPAAEFAMLHQRYGEQQRRMEMSVDALRAHARQVLAQASPELARLAALDGVMEHMLGGREQHALSIVPAFLKKRFEHLKRQAASEAALLLAEGAAPEAPQLPDWLAQLATEFQRALQAELELRLQPIAGMVEALQSSH